MMKKRITVMLPKEEMNFIKEQAWSSGITMSELVYESIGLTVKQMLLEKELGD